MLVAQGYYVPNNINEYVYINEYSSQQVTYSDSHGRGVVIKIVADIVMEMIQGRGCGAGKDKQQHNLWYTWCQSRLYNNTIHITYHADKAYLYQ